MDTIVDVTATTTTNGPTERPCDRAYALGRELQSLAAAQASLDHDFCVLVNRFDATGAIAPLRRHPVDGSLSGVGVRDERHGRAGGRTGRAGVAGYAADQGLVPAGSIVILEDPRTHASGGRGG